MELLLKQKANIEAQDKCGLTVLYAAAGGATGSKGHCSTVELLLSQSADPGAKDEGGQGPLQI